MSRGGRGGFGMRPHALPFEVDPELTEVAENGFDGEAPGKEIFPDFGEMIMAASVTEDEREEVRIGREMDAQRRAGPFWSGTWEQWAQYDAAYAKAGENCDPFGGAATYGKRHMTKMWKPPDFTKVKLHKEFFPKELWDVIGATEGDDDEEGRPAKRQKKLGLAKKSALDKLAKFDDPNDDEANVEAEDEEDEGENGEEGEDPDEEPKDDTFEEDEEELDDYNAELYFDGGEEDYDEGGDDHGEDGY
ncbi:DNA-directed RNA polymerase III subunit C31 [Vermiconidia calcicola]|uniref:DNA-directed RNA polymerase III subunit C31 n=1 Tax=Vermiconidia calcicola TaxID=1690605 RepID=A0ACC3MSY5_9PEZI|nr:DNA-directed RNA polymerase III subunit C31 [Vermiconidia calcicola]